MQNGVAATHWWPSILITREPSRAAIGPPPPPSPAPTGASSAGSRTASLGLLLSDLDLAEATLLLASRCKRRSCYAQVVFHPHYHEPEPGSYRPTTFAVARPTGASSAGNLTASPASSSPTST